MCCEAADLLLTTARFDIDTPALPGYRFHLKSFATVVVCGATGTEEPRPRRLSARRPHPRRASAAVTSLAARAAPHHIQDGGADTQAPDDIDTVISQRHASHSGTSETSPISRRAATCRPTHSN